MADHERLIRFRRCTTPSGAFRCTHRQIERRNRSECKKQRKVKKGEKIRKDKGRGRITEQ